MTQNDIYTDYGNILSQEILQQASLRPHCMDALCVNISSSVEDPKRGFSPEVQNRPSIEEVVSSIKKQGGMLFTARSNDEDPVGEDGRGSIGYCALQINNELEWNKGTFDNRDRKISSISSNQMMEFSIHHQHRKQPQVSAGNLFESPKD